LSGKIFRVGHMGWVEQPDLDAVLHAVQVELNSARAAAPAR
jgi:aspartate aminotransferase-like enzyme